MFYLTARHRAQLRAEEGIESWHFEQHADEAVFIPAGCPHQVFNPPISCSWGFFHRAPATLPCAVLAYCSRSGAACSSILAELHAVNGPGVFYREDSA